MFYNDFLDTHTKKVCPEGEGAIAQMAAKDLYHDCVKDALIKDGWTVTQEQLHLPWGQRNLYVDLAAEQLFVAEKENRKIAVEVKVLMERSVVSPLEKALGQYMLYRQVLQATDPERKLYLAIPLEAFREIFSDAAGEILLRGDWLNLIVFDPNQEVILQWIS